MGELHFLNNEAQQWHAQQPEGQALDPSFDRTLRGFCELEMFDSFSEDYTADEAEALLDLDYPEMIQGLRKTYKITLDEAELAYEACIKRYNWPLDNSGEQG